MKKIERIGQRNQTIEVESGLKGLFNLLNFFSFCCLEANTWNLVPDNFTVECGFELRNLTKECRDSLWNVVPNHYCKDDDDLLTTSHDHIGIPCISKYKHKLELKRNFGNDRKEGIQTNFK